MYLRKFFRIQIQLLTGLLAEQLCRTMSLHDEFIIIRSMKTSKITIIDKTRRYSVAVDCYGYYTMNAFATDVCIRR